MSSKPTFIDVFAGSGGLSLGLLEAGWKGLLAIEKDRHAFSTLSHNLLSDEYAYQFDWPAWFPKQPTTVDDFLRTYSAKMVSCVGDIDLLVGGPPCQGFSSAGHRCSSDPRNQLIHDYLKMVELVQPKIVLIENVRGFTIDFKSNDSTGNSTNYALKLKAKLEEEYFVFCRHINVSTFGVPQNRTRFFMIGYHRAKLASLANLDPFDYVERDLGSFLRRKRISRNSSARAAISDLEIGTCGTIPSEEDKGFDQIAYSGPKTSYQRAMHRGAREQLADTRLARHRPDIAKRFGHIIEYCHESGRLNVSIDKRGRDRFGIKKVALRVLDPDRPAPTITSMPDDLLHYVEPRTLTVRENARLQSFPDWFEFRGKYTTGGHLRKLEVPRFTQVANAVPPLVAEAIGASLRSILAEALEIRHSSSMPNALASSS